MDNFEELTLPFSQIVGEYCLYISGQCTYVILNTPMWPSFSGKLFITNYRLVFIPSEGDKYDNGYNPMILPPHFFKVLNNFFEGEKYLFFVWQKITIGSIMQIEIESSQVMNDRTTHKITLKCKDIRSASLIFKNKNHTLQIRSTLDKIKSDTKNYFAYKYYENLIQLKSSIAYQKNLLDGWKLYDPYNEYKRLNLPTTNWTITQLNNSYKLCETYPCVLGNLNLNFFFFI